MSLHVVWIPHLASYAQDKRISLSKSSAVMNVFLPHHKGKIIDAHALAHPQLYLAHSPHHADGVLKGRRLDGFAKLEGFQPGTPVEHAMLSCGVMVEAVRQAVKAQGRDIICAPVSGFHHAGWAESAGYCTFNGLLLAVQDYRVHNPGALKNVLVIDGDAHYGNGTDDIIERMGLAGIVNLTHRGEGRHSISPVVWEMSIKGALRERQWDLVLYQAGADAHKEDPYGAGYLDDYGWEARDMLVFQHCANNNLPCVFNFAGGYNGARTVHLHMRTMKTAQVVYASPELAPLHATAAD